ncbi:hypothetical protein BHE74_00048921 [Ensete ventricosum]|nr:hypothetical protein BHE74_00048921 [Ensete ventricosum]
MLGTHLLDEAFVKDTTTDMRGLHPETYAQDNRHRTRPSIAHSSTDAYSQPGFLVPQEMPLTPQRPDAESPPLPSEFYLRAPGIPVNRLVSDSRTPTPSLLKPDTLSSDSANSLRAQLR